MTTNRPDAAEPMVGAVLGSYRITSALSSGGMGTVYRAQHELIGRVVAIKFLRPELTTNVELVERFFNEAKAASAIRHPGIVEVFDFGYGDDGAYLIMEFLDGEALCDRIRSRGGRLSEVEAAHVGRGIASALTAAHGRRIVHRDLKPDNVILVADPDVPGGERPKLVDFGIAKLSEPSAVRSHHTQTGALMGTPIYMAPEQARAAQAIDHRADLYSLGCMLYEMLVGQPPFVAPGAGEIIAMHLFTPPERPSARVPVSPEMEAVVMRLLEKEPHARYQTAAEVVDVLGGLVGYASGRLSSPVSAPRPAVIQSPSMELATIYDPPKKKRSAMPILAAVFTIGVAGGTAGLILGRGGNDDKPADPPPPVVEPAKPAVVEVKPDPPKPVDEVRPAEVVDSKPVVDTRPKARPSPAVVKHPEIKTVPADRTPPSGLHTEKASPIEDDVGSLKKTPKAN